MIIPEEMSLVSIEPTNISFYCPHDGQGYEKEEPRRVLQDRGKGDAIIQSVAMYLELGVEAHYIGSRWRIEHFISLSHIPNLEQHTITLLNPFFRYGSPGLHPNAAQYYIRQYRIWRKLHRHGKHN
jgi:hypothetical protein